MAWEALVEHNVEDMRRRQWLWECDLHVTAEVRCVPCMGPHLSADAMRRMAVRPAMLALQRVVLQHAHGLPRDLRHAVMTWSYIPPTAYVVSQYDDLQDAHAQAILSIRTFLADAHRATQVKMRARRVAYFVAFLYASRNGAATGSDLAMQ
eukprot:gene4103-4938_t